MNQMIFKYRSIVTALCEISIYGSDTHGSSCSIITPHFLCGHRVFITHAQKDQHIVSSSSCSGIERSCRSQAKHNLAEANLSAAEKQHVSSVADLFIYLFIFDSYHFLIQACMFCSVFFIMITLLKIPACFTKHWKPITGFHELPLKNLFFFLLHSALHVLSVSVFIFHLKDWRCFSDERRIKSPETWKRNPVAYNSSTEDYSDLENWDLTQTSALCGLSVPLFQHHVNAYHSLLNLNVHNTTEVSVPFIIGTKNVTSFGNFSCKHTTYRPTLPSGKSQPTFHVMVSSLVAPPPPPTSEGATTGTTMRQQQQNSEPTCFESTQTKPNHTGCKPSPGNVALTSFLFKYSIDVSSRAKRNT